MSYTNNCNYGCEKPPASPYEPAKTQAEIEYDRVKTEIDHEFNKKLEDAKNEAAINEARARDNLKNSRIKAEMDELAFRQKCYYDALLTNGFDEKFTKEIFIKSIPMQPIYYGIDWGIGSGLGSCSGG